MTAALDPAALDPAHLHAPGATGRALARVETIADIAPIAGADAIVRARVRGWDVVVRLGEFAVGDRCVYFEVDSMLDVSDPRFAFLAPRGVRTDPDGNSGHVLKTAKLRGQYSQGLALTLASFPEIDPAVPDGTDVTATLGVRKWDPPIPASLAGVTRGPLPWWIPTTDEERVQNCPDILQAGGVLWLCTEKVDGTSTTFWVDPDPGEKVTATAPLVTALDPQELPGASGVFAGVCSRNLDLLPAEGNTLWALARSLDVHAKLAASFPGRRAAVQGETFGEGVQGNPLRLRGQHFAAFTLIVDGHELPRAAWPAWLLELSVPVRDDVPFPGTLDEALAGVDGLRSALADRPAEGVVWRGLDTATVDLPDGRRVRASFKCISNLYLLKNDR